MNKLINPLLNETLVFRPLNNYNTDFPTRTLRYASGEWIPDDGQFDLAFIQGNFVLSVDLPNYSNLLWSWIDYDLTKKWLPEYLHRNIKGWHEVTINNTPLDGEYRRFEFPNDDTHPNAIAHHSAMKKCCELNGYAIGIGPSITNANHGDSKYSLADEYIKRGLLRIQRTNEPVVIPEKLECFLCANNGKGHLLEALKASISDTESSIEYSQERIDKMQSDIYDEEENIEHAKIDLAKLKEELIQLNDNKD
jgi:hypothetical protein